MVSAAAPAINWHGSQQAAPLTRASIQSTCPNMPGVFAVWRSTDADQTLRLGESASLRDALLEHLTAFDSTNHDQALDFFVFELESDPDQRRVRLEELIYASGGVRIESLAHESA